jgi:hypothetical protein
MAKANCKVPEATEQIFRKLLRHKVNFTEAGSIDGNLIFMSGTIAGRPFSLSLSVDQPHELLTDSPEGKS